MGSDFYLNRDRFVVSANLFDFKSNVLPRFKVLAAWDVLQPKFVKIMPRDYRRVLIAQAKAKAEGREPTWSELLGVKHG